MQHKQCVYLKGTGDMRINSFFPKAAGQASEEELICASICNSSVSSGGIFPFLSLAQQPQGMWQGALWGSGDRGSSGEWHREHQEVQVSLVQIISFSLWSGSTLKIGRKLGKR